MEIFIAFVTCTAACLLLTFILEKKRTEITEIYIPRETDTAVTAREMLYTGSLRGSKVIICRTAADCEEIIKNITEEYGKIYKKG
ncbi:MAG: hypothetical protein J6A85_07820 [Clostridia bacterium]|nr:hypothetical protein [Clostridia bacterium]